MHSNQRVKAIEQAVGGGPMSEGEINFLRDVQAFIEFAIHNGISFHAAMAYLSHDWNEFARYGFDYEAAVSRGFTPRVVGYSEFGPDDVGESE